MAVEDCVEMTAPEDILQGSVEERLSREWLLTNRRGAFASGTVIGCPTRRYHGLLIAPRLAPVDQHVLLANCLEEVTCRHETTCVSTFEFAGVFHPEGYRLQRSFVCNLTAADPYVEFGYEHDQFELTKRIELAREVDLVRVRYTLKGSKDEPLHLKVSPLVALRHRHHLRLQPAEDPWLISESDNLLWLQVRTAPDVTLALLADPGAQSARVHFQRQPHWWHNFRYREELARGFPGGEDLQNVGHFDATGVGSLTFELVAVGFAASPVGALEALERANNDQRSTSVVRPPTHDDPVRAALYAAGDQFIVRCASKSRAGGTSIIAGYPWFSDWGRDALIALEGLLLVPGRYEEAKGVLESFAGAQKNGLIPNRFDDYTGECDYNSVDASLWFLHAADAYARYSGDDETFKEVLLPTCAAIVHAFSEGTDFNIHMDESGLIHCGDASTQLTWMDAKANGTVMVPRHGAPVEVNALWYNGLRALTERAQAGGCGHADAMRALTELIEANFERVFWNESANCLFDSVRADGADDSIRPNQIFAISLPHSPIRDPHRRWQVLEAVRHHLLTPMGLRTLSPSNPGYRGRYEGNGFERDSAYHNGTAWAWLLGPFIEAHLRVHNWSDEAKAHARELIAPLLDHLHSAAGLGSISEIFDGDEPHTPRGCFAQAWSVAEILRVYEFVK